MKGYLLDTNICIYYLKGKYNLDKKINSINIKNCYVSEITIAELMYGAENSEFPQKNFKVVEDFQKQFQILPIFGSIGIYAKEKTRLRKNGLLIDDFDLLIGATALFHQLILVTNNTEHLSRVKGVKIEDWTKG